MANDWCPENDGAFRAEAAAMHRAGPGRRIKTLEAENAALREALEDIAAGRTQGIPASVVAALATNSHRTLEAEYSDWLARRTEGEG